MTTERRHFIKKALAGGASLALPAMLGARDDDEQIPGGGGSAKRVIYLLMRGGMSQYETFDLKPNAHHVGSPNQIESVIAGYSVSEWLPQVAKRLDHCAVIRSMTNRRAAHSEDAEYVLRTSYNQRRTIRHPSMGSWVSWHLAKDKEKNHRHFQIGGDAAADEEWLGPDHAPMLIRHPARGSSEIAFRLSGEELDLRQALWKQLNQEYGAKIESATGEFNSGFQLMREGIEETVDVKLAKPADLARYGPHPFGLGCLIARRLAQADASCFTEVILDGWDAPAPYFPAIRERCVILDKALSALLSDLKQLDLLRETLVVLATPLGRRATLHGGTRADYSHAFSCLMAGGGVQGGQVYGSTGDSGFRPNPPVTTYALNRTMAWALGVDYNETAYTPSGRPFTMGANVSDLPLTELFGTTG